jgi:hypothetical protein
MTTLGRRVVKRTFSGFWQFWTGLPRPKTLEADGEYDAEFRNSFTGRLHRVLSEMAGIGARGSHRWVGLAIERIGWTIAGCCQPGIEL